MPPAIINYELCFYCGAEIAKDLEDYYETFHAMHAKVRAFLRSPSLKPYELKDLGQALDLSLKNQLLLTGKATAKIGLEGDTLDRLKNDPAELAAAIASELQKIKELEALEAGAARPEPS